MTSQCVNFMLLALIIMLLGSLQQADSRQQHQQQQQLKQHSSEKSQEHVKTAALRAATTTTKPTTTKRSLTAAMHNKRHHHQQQQQQHSQSAAQNQHHQQEQQHHQQQQHVSHAKQQINVQHNFKIKSSSEADELAAGQQQQSEHIHTHTRHAAAEQQQHSHHQQQQHHRNHHHHHHHQHQHQQQVSEHGHEHQPQELFNHDRHSRALHYDNNNSYRPQQHQQHNNNNHNNNNKRYHSNNNNNNNNNKSHHNNNHRPYTAKTTTATPATEHGMLRLTLNAANEHNTHLGHNHGQDNVDNEDYYDDFDYDDVVNGDDDDNDHSTGHADLQQQHSHKKAAQPTAAAAASSGNYGAAFAPRRVPRDHHYAASRPNSINFDGSNEEDYPADQPYGVITQKKLDELLTPARVENTFQQQFIMPSLLGEQAKAHQRRMDSETRCSRPQPRVIHIRLGTSDTYYPPATVLYRCNESTGCCLLPDHVCGPKHNETVQLPFEVKHGHRGAKRPILLALVNHTECHCDMPTRFGDDLQRRKRSHGSLYTAAPLRIRTLHTEQPISEGHRQASCVCPKHFEHVTSMDNADGENALHDYDYDYETSDDGLTTTTPAPASTPAMQCRCDCHESNRICQRLKQGEEGFAILDRFCISRNECSMPTCSHGAYIRHTGRCPHATSKAGNSGSRHSHSQHAPAHRNYAFG